MKTIPMLAAAALLCASSGLAGNHAKPAADTNVKADHKADHATKANIVAVASENGSFKTLLQALKAAGLVETLEGKGPFTVFAPTDAAFAKLPEGTLDSLLKDKEKLTAILTYHVVPGRVDAKQVTSLKTAKTVQGQSLAIDATDGVTVGGARVVQADVSASNGVIHVIDTVLLPKL